MNPKMVLRFAVGSMKKNKKTMLPFLIAGSVTVMVYNILVSLAFSPYFYVNGTEIFYGAQTIAILLDMASHVVGLFAVIFCVYADRFVMRERKREIGLYGILGLSRGHITRILVIETVIKTVICLGTGMLLGTFLNKLMLLLLYKVIGQPAVSGLFFVPKAAILTLVRFLFIFGLCLVLNICSVSIANPIELLRSDREGEREPKVKIGILLLGVVTLIGGYMTAFRVESASQALTSLFPSIFLVIVGTYALFTAGSIFILKQLKKNRTFYYQTRNFISVANLIYRMKHNAAGLASICILSTAVILLMTCAISLMLLGEKNINDIFRSDVRLEISTNQERGIEEYENQLLAAAKTSGIKADHPVVYRYRRTNWIKTEQGYQAMTEETPFLTGYVGDIYIMTAEDYSRAAGVELMLNEGEVAYHSTWKNGNVPEYLEILGKSFHVKEDADVTDISAVTEFTMTLFERIYLIFDSEQTVKELLAEDGMIEDVSFYQIYEGIDTETFADEDAINRFKDAVEEEMHQISIPDEEQVQDLTGESYYSLRLKQVQKAFFYNMYGGAFFVGIFLAVLFLMATVMIIYYKQMSEGMEDRKRYQILSNVGLTDEEIRRTIGRQVLIVFFLPVVMAVIHMLAAGHIVRLFLSMVLFVDPTVFYLSILVVSAIFAVVYALVYRITSREYYLIVNGKQKNE